MPKVPLIASSLALLTYACTPTLVPPRPPPSSQQVTEEMAGDPDARPKPPPGASAEPPPSGDAPEISRSVGQPGGVIILWPRMAKGGDPQTAELAARVQQKLRAIAQKTLPGAPIDVRPDPERACPRPDGCKATTLGAIVSRKNNACAVVAIVSGAGATPQRLVPWAGATKIDELTVAFRAPPEPHVKVTDYASCAKLDDELTAHEADVAAAIRAAAPSPH